ncbi:MAG: hypothetical protein AB7F86_19650 [Bdellovibrionales bacterium]
MKIRAILISTFLSVVAFDQNLFRRREGVYSSTAGISLTLADEVQQKKKMARPRSVIPPWWTDPAAPVRSKCSYVSVKSKDPRDSNQRKIRRRIMNM